MRSGLKTFGILLALWLCSAALPPSASAADAAAVVATVGDDAIHLGEVERLMAKVVQVKQPRSESRPYVQAQLLEEIIARRLVLAYARRTDEAPTPEEMTAERAKVESQLAAQHHSVADFLKTQSTTEADFDRQLAWNLVWEKYRARYVTPKRLDAFFAAHHRDYDGTEMAVSHILLRPSAAAAGKTATEELVGRAEAIRREILSGKLAFADAARNIRPVPAASRAAGWALSAATARWMNRSRGRPLRWKSEK